VSLLPEVALLSRFASAKAQVHTQTNTGSHSFKMLDAEMLIFLAGLEYSNNSTICWLNLLQEIQPECFLPLLVLRGFSSIWLWLQL